MLKIFIFFVFLIKTFFAISGTSEESYEVSSGNGNKVDLNNLCSCDLTKEVCDYGCDCDPDCLNFMLNKEYINIFSEQSRISSLDSSYINNINNKMDYCNENIKSADDLYNPLVLAFKILKRGFCLVYDNSEKKNEIKDYNRQINKIEFQGNIGNNEIPNYRNVETPDLIASDVANFGEMNYYVPIGLPSGLCVFEYYKIKKYQDYEVICSYKKDQKDFSRFRDLWKDKIVKNYTVNNNYYEIEDSKDITHNLKKVEIFYYDDDANNCEVKAYYENYENNNFQDLTFIIKFFTDHNDYQKSGNPGYIKGNPLLIGEKINLRSQTESSDDNFIFYEKSNNDIIFPIDNNQCNDQSNTSFIYFDNYFNNKITFEDFMIYRYENIECLDNTINQFFSDKKIEKGFGKYGNANIRYFRDWNTINYENKNFYYPLILLLGTYKEVGTVNNTQLELLNLDYYSPDIGGNYKYFINKFIKPKIVETEWWYARPPGFIRLPKNIMYPFKIGTTDYQDK